MTGWGWDSSHPNLSGWRGGSTHIMWTGVVGQESDRLSNHHNKSNVLWLNKNSVFVLFNDSIFLEKDNVFALNKNDVSCLSKNCALCLSRNNVFLLDKSNVLCLEKSGQCIAGEHKQCNICFTRAASVNETVASVWTSQCPGCEAGTMSCYWTGTLPSLWYRSHVLVLSKNNAFFLNKHNVSFFDKNVPFLDNTTSCSCAAAMSFYRATATCSLWTTAVPLCDDRRQNPHDNSNSQGGAHHPDLSGWRGAVRMISCWKAHHPDLVTGMPACWFTEKAHTQYVLRCTPRKRIHSCKVEMSSWVHSPGQ